MLARNAQAEVNVLALIGERGREVKEFLERDLGPEGLLRGRFGTDPIGAPAGTAIVADACAMQPLHDDVRIFALPSPMQCPA